MLEQLDVAARRAAPAVDRWAVRGVVERSEELNVRQGAVQSPVRRLDSGAMVTVLDRGGVGYAATGDTSLDAWWAKAVERAAAAEKNAAATLESMPRPAPR